MFQLLTIHKSAITIFQDFGWEGSTPIEVFKNIIPHIQEDWPGPFIEIVHYFDSRRNFSPARQHVQYHRSDGTADLIPQSRVLGRVGFRRFGRFRFRIGFSIVVIERVPPLRTKKVDTREQ